MHVFISPYESPIKKLQIAPEITLLTYSVLKLRVFLQLDFVTLTFEKNTIESQLPVLAMAKYLCSNGYYDDKKQNSGFKLHRGIGERQKILKMTSSKNGYGMTIF